tara:strand:+ start:622 stop:849 length:228 start_codon:yes stop_codon:yes gene_type:complete
MQFTKTHEDFDDSDNSITVTRTFDAVLNGSILEISEIIDGSSVLSMIQPWKPNQDGSRSNWVDINEAVEWYKLQA